MLAAISLLLASLQPAADVSVLPRPRTMEIENGSFEFTPRTRLENPAGFAAADQLQDVIIGAGGHRLRTEEEPPRGQENRVTFRQMRGSHGPEEYRIQATSEGLIIEANEDRGAFLAVQTIRQLLPPSIESLPRTPQEELAIPLVNIHDWPAFSWRGLHLDVSRHFFSIEFIKKYIDWIALHRMNTFHWHLIDDGGWRMESKKYPLLTEKGAWRLGGPGEWSYSDIVFPDDRTGKEVYGGFYTQDEIRDVVAYAAERHITVVPEIEMPGHCWPALSCYPELGCDLSDRKIPNVFCPGNEKAFAFLEDILDETLELFPSEFIHIGADEVNRSDWERCPDCAKRMAAEGLDDAEELQSYFVRRMERYLRSKGRRLIGWDEILEGGLAPGAAVMSWRGIEGGRDAALAGQFAVMSPTSHCYFDYSYANISTRHVYGWDPIPTGLNAEQRRLILGGQANIWTEWIPTEDRCEYMIFPRVAALAESLWLEPDLKDWEKFDAMMPGYLARLDRMQINYNMPVPDLPVSAWFLDGDPVELSIQNRYPAAMTLRYTADGSLPTLDSPTVPQRLSLQAGQYTFAYVNARGVAGDPARLTVSRPEFMLPATFSSGLRVESYVGKWDKMPNFDRLKPVKTGIAAAVTADHGTQPEEFGLRFTGWLQVPEDGRYTFALGSDDGSRFWLGGALIVDHDGPHGYSEKLGRVRLKKGTYPIRIEFFEAGGAERLTLRWGLSEEQLAPIGTQHLKH